MSMIKKIVLALALTTLSAPSISEIGTGEAQFQKIIDDASISKGKEKSITCMGCHGIDGNSAAPTFPNLAGQHASYLYKQLMEFKSGKRANATMMAMVAALSKEDLANLAKFYSIQKLKLKNDQKASNSGRKIYHDGIPGDRGQSIPACQSCHQADGLGNNEANFPALKGQKKNYIVSQLKGFKSKMRNNDAGQMMRTISKNMTEEEMQAVADYIENMK